MGFINNLVNFYLNKILNEIVTVSYASKKSLIKNSKFLTKKRKIKIIYNGIVVKKIKRKNYLSKYFKKKKILFQCACYRELIFLKDKKI